MKRENGAGSVYQRKDGRWVAKVLDPVDGRMRYRYCKTRSQAVAQLQSMLQRVEGGAAPVDSRMTVSAFAETWLSGRAGSRRSPASVYEYESRLRNHVLPVIGHKRLDRLSIRDIEGVLDRAASSGLSPSTVKAIKNAVAAMLSDARRDRVIASNPAADAEMPRMAPRPRKKSPSSAEVRQLLQEARSIAGEAEGEVGRILLMCAHTGARIGEVLACQWADLDLGDGRWRLVRTVTKDRHGRLTVGNRTKSGEARDVALTAELVKGLQVQHDYVVYRQSMTRLWMDEGWVFPSTTGTLKDPHNLRRLLHSAFPTWPYGFHDLRRWFISIGLGPSGPGDTQVARFVGHQSTRTTKDVYGSLLNEGASQVLNSVTAALQTPESER